MSSAASAHKKCLAQKVVRFGSPGWIPMIQAPFNSSYVALQYKTTTTYHHFKPVRALGFRLGLLAVWAFYFIDPTLEV